MTSLRIQTVQDKLFRLNENIKFIEDVLLKHSDENILKKNAEYYAIEHMLQICMEIIFDISSHILAEDFATNPKTYQEIIVSLGEKGIVAKEFASAQSEMAKFRNKLVHNYDTIDEVQVIAYAHEAPAIFRIFGKTFVEYITKK